MNITSQQAKVLAESGWWEGKSARELAVFQMHTEYLCMPFSVFHEAITKALGRDVYTHEFGLDPDGLRMELQGERPKPTDEEILALIPPEKLILIKP